MTERIGSLGDRITSLSGSLNAVLGHLDEKIARYERERTENDAVERVAPPENFRAHLFSGGGGR
ncbi:hypothetical protein ACFWZ7_19475 [Nocardiopsis alba]|uniref:hypothetical protein n=1 Tax=Nocardiopsis alba TaxID=53437 RepID=UPI003671E709